MLLQPFIKVNKAECYYCRVPLHLYTFDALDITLSPEGYPLGAEVIKTAISGICVKCGRLYNMERRGMGFCTAGYLPIGGYNNEETAEEQSAIASYGENEFINDTRSSR